MRVIKQVQRRDYLRRHLWNFLPHLTPRKAFNAAWNLLERRRRVIAPRSFPPYLKIETTPLCQLQCPGCPQSLAAYKNGLSGDMQMTLEQFRRIIEPLADTTIGISLCNQGEPLLNQQLPQMIRVAHDLNIAVSFPTNLSLPLSTARIDELVESGLDTLYVSLDGVSEASYLKYRIGGRFQLVRDNVQALAAAKRRLGRRTPRLVWKFILFDHNREEADMVRARFRDWGFDDFELTLDNRSPSFKAAHRDFRSRSRANGRSCYWPWHAMIVHWNGNVSPCCSNWDFGIGNAIDTSLRDIWRSDSYRELRAGLVDPVGAQLHPRCRRCLADAPGG